MRRIIILAGQLVTSTATDNTSTQGQHFSCTTDPGTGGILACGAGRGSSGGSTCEDIDEDGDGEPHDQPGDTTARLAPHDGADDGSGSDADDAHDGIPNSEDCD